MKYFIKITEIYNYQILIHEDSTMPVILTSTYFVIKLGIPSICMEEWILLSSIANSTLICKAMMLREAMVRKRGSERNPEIGHRFIVLIFMLLVK